MNQAEYFESVNDPLFCSHINFTENATQYYADRLASPLGYVSQQQFCNPKLPPEPGCTSMASVDQPSLDIPIISLNPKQLAIYRRLIRETTNSSLLTIIDLLDTDILLASQFTSQGYAPALPEIQWKLEITHFHSVMMACMQSLIVSYATGPSNRDYAHYLMAPNTTEDEQMCANQMITRTDYASFTTFGIATILGDGGLFILINLTLEPLTKVIRKLTGMGTYKQLEWV